MKRIREKKHRLAHEEYQGFVTVAFTACVKDRIELFKDRLVVRKFEEILLTEAAAFHCWVVVYLFMPDHLHTILQGKGEEARPLDAMRRFKQKSGYWLSKNHPRGRWQKDFYDHIIRTEKDISKHLRYILDNPTRKRLVNDWREYQFKGSTLYHLNEMFL
jgi:REP element-mobilizing transposase RayT